MISTSGLILGLSGALLGLFMSLRFFKTNAVAATLSLVGAGILVLGLLAGPLEAILIATLLSIFWAIAFLVSGSSATDARLHVIVGIFRLACLLISFFFARYGAEVPLSAAWVGIFALLSLPIYTFEFSATLPTWREHSGMVAFSRGIQMVLGLEFLYQANQPLQGAQGFAIALLVIVLFRLLLVVRPLEYLLASTNVLALFLATLCTLGAIQENDLRALQWMILVAPMTLCFLAALRPGALIVTSALIWLPIPKSWGFIALTHALSAKSDVPLFALAIGTFICLGLALSRVLKGFESERAWLADGWSDEWQTRIALLIFIVLTFVTPILIERGAV